MFHIVFFLKKCLKKISFSLPPSPSIVASTNYNLHINFLLSPFAIIKQAHLSLLLQPFAYNHIVSLKAEGGLSRYAFLACYSFSLGLSRCL